MLQPNNHPEQIHKPEQTRPCDRPTDLIPPKSPDTITLYGHTNTIALQPPETVELQNGIATMFSAIGKKDSNDDRAFLAVHRKAGRSIDTLGALDGTGPAGGAVCDYAIRNLIDQTNDGVSDMREAIKNISHNLSRSTKNFPRSGAAIALVEAEVLQDGIVVKVSHIGDCRVLIFDRRDGDYICVFRNSRHNAYELLAEQGFTKEVILTTLKGIEAKGISDIERAFVVVNSKAAERVPREVWYELHYLWHDKCLSPEEIVQVLPNRLLRGMQTTPSGWYTTPDSSDTIAVSSEARIMIFTDGIDLASEAFLSNLCSKKGNEIADSIYRYIGEAVANGYERDNFCGVVYELKSSDNKTEPPDASR